LLGLLVVVVELMARVLFLQVVLVVEVQEELNLWQLHQLLLTLEAVVVVLVLAVAHPSKVLQEHLES
jgi:hypothetical protein